MSDQILPFDNDAYDPRAPQKPGPVVLGGDFAYIGTALTIPEFVAYIGGYDFGSIPPDYVVLHHTAIPTLPQWCADEGGLDDAGIRDKRLSQLSHIRDFYAAKGWDCGPHLFIDDTYIYLFTPMNQVGIHAKWGNSFRAMGRLHYAIGIEVIGDYRQAVWPAPVAATVRGAVQALQSRLKTFALRPLYPTPASAPGMTGTGEGQRCARPELLRFGAVASHRDFNKPECPGAAITEAYYIGVLTDSAPVAPVAPITDSTDITADALLLHAPRATEAQCVAALIRRPTGGYTSADVAHIVGIYHAQSCGVDPLLAIAQMAHETGFLSSWWAQRPRRNPAGIGVTGVAGAGLRFASWELAVAAHIGRLLAYALPDGAGNAAQKALITRALALRPMPLAFRGVASRLRGLNGRWAVPGTDYADKIAAIANAIRGTA